ncbi:hypothetical protein INT44_001637 [Umbelopsis vinacea]|uniref:Uncharacterized protein n=1 Tax=Umbelopsis vinacea TaxID=44442 RepID=A0A8H7PRJ8_9FUNG|nr:hypothetical protein INT44_001637 [Umbelopsis vinacea]
MALNAVSSPTYAPESIAPTHQQFEPQAEDILCDEELLDLFRTVKQVLRKKPNTERISKLLFCFCYALGEDIKFYKEIGANEDRMFFKEESARNYSILRLPYSSNDPAASRFKEYVTNRERAARNGTAQSPIPVSANVPERMSTGHPLSVSYLTGPGKSTGADYHSQPSQSTLPPPPGSASPGFQSYRPLVPATPNSQQTVDSARRNMSMDAHISGPAGSSSRQHSFSQPQYKYPGEDSAQNKSNFGPRQLETIEPHQRGFYYEEGRLSREDAVLRRYAEQGVLTQASLLRKRKRRSTDLNFSLGYPTSEAPPKKTKMPHRHGEFEQRRDDIIIRLRTITETDLDQKAAKLGNDFTLEIEHVDDVEDKDYKPEEATKALEPSLRVLTAQANLKPHLDNGMNQNGIYYNTDYFRLYLAFEQFQKAHTKLYPQDKSDSPDGTSAPSTPSGGIMSTMSSSFGQLGVNHDSERSVNMKIYRSFVEPHLTETNWAAFRRNIVVGERMMQLTKILGQGVLLMTKELSGSKIHLTFTNNEWDEFLNGLRNGKWDDLFKDLEPAPDGGSALVRELKSKFETSRWFTPTGEPAVYSNAPSSQLPQAVSTTSAGTDPMGKKRGFTQEPQDSSDRRSDPR